MSDFRPEERHVFEELRRSLNALASSGGEALATLPDGCVKADELALDDSDALLVAQNFRAKFSDLQWAALGAVDELLDLMSGEKNATP